MSYFKQERETKAQRMHRAHGELIALCAAHIAQIKDAEKREDTLDALCSYMSIKLGETPREVIVAAYREAVQDAMAANAASK